MKVNHVEGANRGDLIVYTLSTCVWCKKTKAFLNDLGIGYNFVEVDKLEGDEREQVLTEIKQHNPQCSFPTMVVNGKDCIIGYNEQKIKETLGV